MNNGQMFSLLATIIVVETLACAMMAGLFTLLMVDPALLQRVAGLLNRQASAKDRRSAWRSSSSANTGANTARASKAQDEEIRHGGAAAGSIAAIAAAVCIAIAYCATHDVFGASVRVGWAAFWRLGP